MDELSLVAIHVGSYTLFYAVYCEIKFCLEGVNFLLCLELVFIDLKLQGSLVVISTDFPHEKFLCRELGPCDPVFTDLRGIERNKFTHASRSKEPVEKLPTRVQVFNLKS